MVIVQLVPLVRVTPNAKVNNLTFFFLSFLILYIVSCGNGTCDAEIGENCITCPQHCTQASSGNYYILFIFSCVLVIKNEDVCGDGFCSDTRRVDHA